MLIWILVNKANPENSLAIQRYIDEAEALGWECRKIGADTIDIIVNREGERSLILEGERTVLPDVVIPKTGAGSSYFVLAILRQLEKLGVVVVNNADSVMLAKDKLQSFQVLATESLPIPKTMLAKFPVPPELIEKEFGYPFVMKKLSGSQGRGVMLIKEHQQLEDVLGMMDTTTKDENHLIFQQYISASKGMDLRVIVVGGRAIGAMKRTGKAGSFKANFSAGGTVENYPLTQEIEWLAIEAANTLGLSLAGVDLLFDDKGHFQICEVNSNPGIEGFEQATNINVPGEVYKFLALKFPSFPQPSKVKSV